MEQKDELKKEMNDDTKHSENENTHYNKNEDDSTEDCQCKSESCKTSSIGSSEEENQQETNDFKECDSYRKKYEDLLKEKEEINDRFIRLQADFSNYKKRVAKDKAQMFAYAAEEVITQLLPALDNFERALSSAINKDDEFYKGMEMIYKQTVEILENNGLKEIKALGEKFDPNFHHAAAIEENKEYEENTIIEVFQKGYLLKDKVIRPSIVKVNK